MLTQYSAEELNQNYDNMSCVTGVTVTTGITFYTQHTQFNIPEECRHTIDKSYIESKMKQTATVLGHLQEFMNAINHQPSTGTLPHDS